MAGGRPTTYKPENAEIARYACMLGATNEILAERFEVSPAHHRQLDRHDPRV